MSILIWAIDAYILVGVLFVAISWNNASLETKAMYFQQIEESQETIDRVLGEGVVSKTTLEILVLIVAVVLWLPSIFLFNRE